MENPSGLVPDSCLMHAMRPLSWWIGAGMGASTFGGDKGYDAARFIADLHQRRITPNIAVNGRISKLGVRRRSGMDDATTSSAGYVASQRVRNRVEEVFGWIKAAAGPR